MLGEDIHLKGGIASVLSTYMDSELSENNQLFYVPTYTGKSRIFLSFFKALFVFFYDLIFQKIDIVHIHSGFKGSFYRKSVFVLFSFIFRKKIILHIHSGEFDEFYRKGSFLRKSFIKLVLSIPQVIMVVSPSLKNKIKKITPSPDKLRLVMNPVRIHQNIEEKVHGKDNQTRILFMGRINEKKGVYDLIKAGEKIIPCKKNILFVLCGNGEIAKAKQMIVDKGIQRYFKIPGKVDDKEKYYSEADIFVLPSYYEGIPVSILEAASYALPIIATSVGGIPEVIKDGKNGLLFEPGDVEDLSGLILKLIDSPNERKRMGKQAYDLVNEKFNINLISQQLESIYRNLFLYESNS